MRKQESLDIRKKNNGYLVQYSYHEPTEKNSYGEYKSEDYIFVTYDEVMDFVKNHELGQNKN